VFTPVSSDLIFKGRPGDLRFGEWLHQREISQSTQPSRSIALFGCPDDTGVRLNRGRAGAQEGPDSIRKALYKMTCPRDSRWSSVGIFDLGNIQVEAEIQKTHKNAEDASRSLAQEHAVIVLLGGGHDFAAPGISGWISGRQKTSGNLGFGVINIDPHLDVRELEDGVPNSGTAFRQLLESGHLTGSNFIQFGCRENRNAPDHWNYCESQGTSLISLEKITSQIASPPQQFGLQMNRLAKRVDALAVTLDLDCCHELPGTSAAPAIGFSIRELCQMAYAAGCHSQVSYFELAEVSPPWDPTGKTANAAAEILYAFLSGKISQGLGKTPLRQIKKPNKTPKNIKNRNKRRV